MGHTLLRGQTQTVQAQKQEQRVGHPYADQRGHLARLARGNPQRKQAVIHKEQQQGQHQAALTAHALHRNGDGDDKYGEHHAGNGKHPSLVPLHHDFIRQTRVPGGNVLHGQGDQFLPAHFLGLDRAEVQAAEHGTQRQAHHVFVKAQHRHPSALLRVHAAVFEQKQKFAPIVVGVHVSVRRQNGQGGVGAGSILHQNMSQSSRSRVDLTREKHHARNVFVEHARLDDDAGPTAGDIQNFGPKMSHAPGQPVQRHPDGEAGAQDRERQRRGQHLVQADPPGLESHQFAVRAHA